MSRLENTQQRKSLQKHFLVLSSFLYFALFSDVPLQGVMVLAPILQSRRVCLELGTQKSS